MTQDFCKFIWRFNSIFYIGRVIDQQNKEIRARKIQNGNSKVFDFENYHDYNEVTMTYLLNKDYIWEYSN